MREKKGFIDRTTYLSLQIQTIWDMIKPVSSLGKKKKQNAPFYGVGKEKQLQAEYEKLNLILGTCNQYSEVLPSLLSWLSHIDEIRLTIERSEKSIALELHELFEVKNFVFFYERIRLLCLERGLGGLYSFDDLSSILSLLDIDNQGVPAFCLSDQYSEELAAIRKSVKLLNEEIDERKRETIHKACNKLQVEQMEETVLVSRYNKELISRIESTALFQIEKENFANISFSLKKTEQQLALEDDLQEAKKALEEVDKRVRLSLTERIKQKSKHLINAQNEIGNLDFLLARMVFGKQYNCLLPVVKENNRIGIVEAINIPISLKLQEMHIAYQPISIMFDERINILTGANMGGKTTILKTIGQIAFLYAHACPVPCKEISLPLFNYLWFCGPISEQDRADLSSFASEMMSFNQNYQREDYGLFLLDEFARGTNPEEGEAIHAAVIESFCEKEAWVIAATHFRSTSSLQNIGYYRVIGIKEEDYAIIQQHANLELSLLELHNYMDYRIIKVNGNTTPPRSALSIAEILGFNKNILDKAKQYLARE